MSDTQLALIVYILYFAAYITGITGLIGVIIAHVKIGVPTRCCARITSFKFARSGSEYCIWWSARSWRFVVIGFLVLLWWFIWSLVRNVKGVLALNENKPIANPASWMFG